MSSACFIYLICGFCRVTVINSGDVRIHVTVIHVATLSLASVVVLVVHSGHGASTSGFETQMGCV